MDYRRALISEVCGRVGRIVCFTSGKGGVGKSVVCAASAILLSKKGKVGVFDFDLHGCSIPKILGIREFPREENGLLPVEARGIKVFSIGLMTEPLPVFGDEILETILEAFAIVNWGEVDFLLVDMPPGMGEELSLAIELKPSFIVVTTASTLSWGVSKRLIHILRRAQTRILGVVENMSTGEPVLKREIEEMGLGHALVRFDRELENSIGENFPPKKFSEDVERMLHEFGIA